MRFTWILFAYFLTSCTNFVKKVQQQDVSTKSVAEKQHPTFCFQGTHSLSGLSLEAQEVFQNTVKKVSQNPRQQVFLWTIYQSYLLPHLAAPNSQAMLLIWQKDAPLIRLDLSADFFHLLKQMAQELKLNDSESLLRRFEKALPSRLPLERKLFQFITQHQDQLKSQPALEKFYFRQGELLRLNDRIEKQKTARFYQGIYPPKMIRSEKFTQHDWSCNFKPRTYPLPQIPQIHTFSFSTPKLSLIGVVGQDLSQFSVYPAGSIFLKAKVLNKGQLAGVCTREGSTFEALISTASRGYDQLFEHLPHQQLQQTQNLKEWSFLMNQPRWISLLHPERILVETTTLPKKQLQQFLQRDSRPFYHSYPLGKIIGLKKMQGKAQVVLDQRYQDYLSCY